MLGPAFDRARPLSLVVSEDALGLLHQLEQPERSLPDAIELSVPRPCGPFFRALGTPFADEPAVSREPAPSFACRRRFLVCKMETPIADRAGDSAALRLEFVDTVDADSVLRQFHGAERSEPATRKARLRLVFGCHGNPVRALLHVGPHHFFSASRISRSRTLSSGAAGGSVGLACSSRRRRLMARTIRNTANA